LAFSLRYLSLRFMALADKLESDISTIFNAVWNIREGRVVPSTVDVALTNGAVKLDAAFLYADLAESTRLARTFPASMTAKIVRAYLSSMSQLVKQAGGHIRSFDGDRVMGVFVGDTKNTDAARCALKMNYTVTQILRPQAEVKFPSLKKEGFAIRHCAGIHRSSVLVVRGGVRGSNDLVFVGNAPNLAAKLSEYRADPYNTYITHTVYSWLKEPAKLGGDPPRNMWSPVKCKLGHETWDCYRSNWRWKP
jgi:adenylate cyclase